MINIETRALEEMKRDAIKSFPDECCGFFFGQESGEERTVLEATPVNNVKEGDKRRRFEIGPTDYLRAERYAEDNGLLLLGVYHSHPNHPAIPSEHDRQAAQPYFSYIILSVINAGYAGLRSWRLNEDRQFEEEKIFDSQYI